MTIAFSNHKRKVCVIFAPDWSTSRPWAAVVKEGRAVADILSQSADSLECADDAIEYARKARIGVVCAEEYLVDQWICRWQIRGGEMYRDGLPRELCNQYERQGWDAEQADDRTPYRVFGWPTGQEVAA